MSGAWEKLLKDAQIFAKQASEASNAKELGPKRAGNQPQRMDDLNQKLNKINMAGDVQIGLAMQSEPVSLVWVNPEKPSEVINQVVLLRPGSLEDRVNQWVSAWLVEQSEEVITQWLAGPQKWCASSADNIMRQLALKKGELLIDYYKSGGLIKVVGGVEGFKWLSIFGLTIMQKQEAAKGFDDRLGFCIHKDYLKADAGGFIEQKGQRWRYEIPSKTKTLLLAHGYSKSVQEMEFLINQAYYKGWFVDESDGYPLGARYYKNMSLSFIDFSNLQSLPEEQAENLEKKLSEYLTLRKKWDTESVIGHLSKVNGQNKESLGELKNNIKQVLRLGSNHEIKRWHEQLNAVVFNALGDHVNEVIKLCSNKESWDKYESYVGWLMQMPLKLHQPIVKEWLDASVGVAQSMDEHLINKKACLYLVSPWIKWINEGKAGIRMNPEVWDDLVSGLIKIQPFALIDVISQLNASALAEPEVNKQRVSAWCNEQISVSIKQIHDELFQGIEGPTSIKSIKAWLENKPYEIDNWLGVLLLKKMCQALPKNKGYKTDEEALTQSAESFGGMDQENYEESRALVLKHVAQKVKEKRSVGVLKAKETVSANEKFLINCIKALLIKSGAKRGGLMHMVLVENLPIVLASQLARNLGAAENEVGLYELSMFVMKNKHKIMGLKPQSKRHSKQSGMFFLALLEYMKRYGQSLEQADRVLGVSARQQIEQAASEAKLLTEGCFLKDWLSAFFSQTQYADLDGLIKKMQSDVEKSNGQTESGGLEKNTKSNSMRL